MTKELKKETVCRTLFYLEDGELFGKIEDVIKYLQKTKAEHPDKQLFVEAVWTGYEDCHYEIQYFSEETGEEFQRRKTMAEYQEKIKREQEAARKAKQEKEKQYQKLKRELGYY